MLIARASKATCVLNDCLVEALGAHSTKFKRFNVISSCIEHSNFADVTDVHDLVYLHNEIGGTGRTDTWGRLLAPPVEFPQCKRILTVYNRRTTEGKGTFEESHNMMLNHFRLHEDHHSLHVFCDTRVLSQDKRTPFDMNFAARLCELLDPDKGVSLMSGTWINLTESAAGDGRAIAGVMTGGVKLPLGATV